MSSKKKRTPIVTQGTIDPTINDAIQACQKTINRLDKEIKDGNRIVAEQTKELGLPTKMQDLEQAQRRLLEYKRMAAKHADVPVKIIDWSTGTFNTQEVEAAKKLPQTSTSNFPNELLKLQKQKR